MLDLSSIFEIGLIVVVLTFLFVDFFDTAGTLTSVANMAGKVDADGKVEGIGRAVISDGAATHGRRPARHQLDHQLHRERRRHQGGRPDRPHRDQPRRCCFLLCLFLAPIAKTIPGWATAPALVFVATFFARNLKDLDWEDMSDYGPAILAAVTMPFTFSIANGIAIGFTAYVLVKALTGRAKDIHVAVWLLAIVSVLYFVKDF